MEEEREEERVDSEEDFSNEDMERLRLGTANDTAWDPDPGVDPLRSVKKSSVLARVREGGAEAGAIMSKPSISLCEREGVEAFFNWSAAT